MNTIILVALGAWIAHGFSSAQIESFVESAPQDPSSSESKIIPTDEELFAVVDEAYARACSGANGKMIGSQCVYANKQVCESSPAADGTQNVWDEENKRCVLVITALKKVCDDNPTHVPSFIDLKKGMYKCQITEDYCRSMGSPWRSDLQDCHTSTVQFVLESVLGTTVTRSLLKGDDYIQSQLKDNLGETGAVIGKLLPTPGNVIKAEEMLQQAIGVDYSNKEVGTAFGVTKEVGGDIAQNGPVGALANQISKHLPF